LRNECHLYIMAYHVVVAFFYIRLNLGPLDWRNWDIIPCVMWLKNLQNYRITWRIYSDIRARGSVVGWGTMLQARRLQVWVPMRWIFFNLPNPSSHTMALRSTQPLSDMSTRNLPGG
jgi:hypothetical protein